MDAFLDHFRYSIEVETNYSTYHLLWLLLYALMIIYLLVFYRKMSDFHFRLMLFIVGISFLIGEILKLLIIFHHDGVWTIDYYYLPWQFCSTPIYYTWIVALIKNKKIYQGFLTYLAFYCLIAGGASIFVPETIFTHIAWNNLHTLLLHGGMVVIAIYIIGSNRLDLKWQSFLIAAGIFTISTFIALGLNVFFHFAKPEAGVDFFFINPYITWGPPIVIKVRNALAYPIYLAGYMIGFSGSALLLFYIDRLCHQWLMNKNKMQEDITL